MRRTFKVPDISSSDVQALRAVIECVAGQSDAPSVDVARRLGDQLRDLMDIVLDVPTATGRRRTAAAIVYHAKQFVARHAGDSAFTPELIAAQFGFPGSTWGGVRSSGAMASRQPMSIARPNPRSRHSRACLRRSTSDYFASASQNCRLRALRPQLFHPPFVQPRL